MNRMVRDLAAKRPATSSTTLTSPGLPLRKSIGVGVRVRVGVSVSVRVEVRVSVRGGCLRKSIDVRLAPPPLSLGSGSRLAKVVGTSTAASECAGTTIGSCVTGPLAPSPLAILLAPLPPPTYAVHPRSRSAYRYVGIDAGGSPHLGEGVGVGVGVGLGVGVDEGER